MVKIALITGITGQDGSYLTEYLLELGYVVYGIVRRSSSFNTQRIDHLMDTSSQDFDSVPDWCKPFGKNLFLVFGDLLDGSSIFRIVKEIDPDEIYNLGAQSHVRVSFDQPELTFNVNALGTIRLLEAIRDSKKQIRLYNAASSEIFGNSPPPQNEKSVFAPVSPYGVSKLAAYWQVVNYRNNGLFACNGILGNHESNRRGESFVTKKITKAAARIKFGLQKEIVLGNLEAKRDWGYAPDYVKMMHLMLQQKEPDDYVVATGESHSVREFLEAVFNRLGLDPYKYLKIDQRYFRPKEINMLLGDSSKAKNKLNWIPKTTFRELVNIMTDYDLESIEK